MLRMLWAVVGTVAVVGAQSFTPVRYETGNPQVVELWVDPANGNDSNSGAARGTALRTLTAAWGRVPARQNLTVGYRIRVTAGTLGAGAAPGYWESRWGSAQAPVFVEAVDGAGTVTLPALNIYDCRYLYLIGLVSTAGGGDVVHCEKCDHLLLRQMTITGLGDVNANASPQEALKVNQSTHVYVEDSDISGGYDNALDFVAVQAGHIVFNRIHRAQDWCLYVKGGSAQIRIEGNEIYDCGTGGFTAGQGTGFEFMTAPWLQYEATDVKFFNNVIHDTQGAGFGVNGGQNILLAHNTLYRTGARSHGMEFVFGGRVCDGDTARCAAHRSLGGWGPAGGSGEESIPNRNVYVYNNVLLNPAPYRSQWQHFAIYPPRTGNSAAPNPAVSDLNLQIKGNVIVNGSPDLPLGIEGNGQGCADSNPTCNAAQLRRENAINTGTPQFRNAGSGDFHPVAVANGVAIPTFPAAVGVPAGNADNTIGRDREGRARTRMSAGAYEAGDTVAVSPITPSPLALRFTQAMGGAAPAARTVTVAAAVSTAFTVVSSAAWLTATPTAGSTTTSLQVTANAAGLGLGTHEATLQIQAANAQAAVVTATLVVFAPGSSSQVFNDVALTHEWVDFIYLLRRFAVTIGCSDVPPLYCPLGNVTQEQMAAFVIRAIAGENFAYPATPYFSDVPASNYFFKYIQKMRELNINPGCGGGRFCPGAFVRRDEMAQYVIRSRFGDTFSYNPTARFPDDVPATHAAFPHVQKMWELGITQGCGARIYCASDNITREQMAAFLSRAYFQYGNLTPSPLPVVPPPAPPPAPVRTPPSVGGCDVFPYNNVWNTPVETLPVHGQSSAWVNTIGASRTLKADFGSGLWDGGPIGIPFVVVPNGQARVNVTFEYAGESDPGPYPVPPNPPIEGGNASTGDRHILILEQGACRLWELYSAYPQPNGSYTAGSGAVFDLKVNGPLRPAGWTSADAAGLPILPGLVRYDEVAAGEIKHAIRFTVPQSKREYLWPARHFASSLTGSQYPPMGARFRLKADYDISTFDPAVQVILRAMKKYGIINADNGSAWFLSGVPDERWNNEILRQFGRIPGSALEAVDTSSMIVDSNSGEARQP